MNIRKSDIRIQTGRLTSKGFLEIAFSRNAALDEGGGDSIFEGNAAYLNDKDLAQSKVATSEGDFLHSEVLVILNAWVCLIPDKRLERQKEIDFITKNIKDTLREHRNEFKKLTKCVFLRITEIPVTTQKELTDSLFSQVNINAAYIQCGQKLFYINKKNNECEEIKCLPAQLKQLFSSISSNTPLEEKNFLEITNVLSHNHFSRSIGRNRNFKMNKKEAEQTYIHQNCDHANCIKERDKKLEEYNKKIGKVTLCVISTERNPCTHCSKMFSTIVNNANLSIEYLVSMTGKERAMVGSEIKYRFDVHNSLMEGDKAFQEQNYEGALDAYKEALKAILKIEMLFECNRVLISRKNSIESEDTSDKHTIYILENKAYWYKGDVLQPHIIGDANKEILLKSFKHNQVITNNEKKKFLHITQLCNYPVADKTQAQKISLEKDKTIYKKIRNTITCDIAKTEVNFQIQQGKQAWNNKQHNKAIEYYTRAKKACEPLRKIDTENFKRHQKMVIHLNEDIQKLEELQTSINNKANKIEEQLTSKVPPPQKKFEIYTVEQYVNEKNIYPKDKEIKIVFHTHEKKVMLYWRENDKVQKKIMAARQLGELLFKKIKKKSGQLQDKPLIHEVMLKFGIDDPISKVAEKKGVTGNSLSAPLSLLDILGAELKIDPKELQNRLATHLTIYEKHYGNNPLSDENRERTIALAVSREFNINIAILVAQSEPITVKQVNAEKSLYIARQDILWYQPLVDKKTTIMKYNPIDYWDNFKKLEDVYSQLIDEQKIILLIQSNSGLEQINPQIKQRNEELTRWISEIEKILSFEEPIKPNQLFDLLKRIKTMSDEMQEIINQFNRINKEIFYIIADITDQSQTVYQEQLNRLVEQLIEVYSRRNARDDKATMSEEEQKEDSEEQKSEEEGDDSREESEESQQPPDSKLVDSKKETQNNSGIQPLPSNDPLLKKVMKDVQKNTIQSWDEKIQQTAREKNAFKQAEPWEKRGSVYYSIADFTRAYADFSASLAIHPSNKDIQKRKEKALKNLKNKITKVLQYSQALENNKDEEALVKYIINSVNNSEKIESIYNNLVSPPIKDEEKSIIQTIISQFEEEKANANVVQAKSSLVPASTSASNNSSSSSSSSSSLARPYNKKNNNLNVTRNKNQVVYNKGDIGLQSAIIGSYPTGYESSSLKQLKEKIAELKTKQDQQKREGKTEQEYVESQASSKPQKAPELNQHSQMKVVPVISPRYGLFKPPTQNEALNIKIKYINICKELLDIFKNRTEIKNEQIQDINDKLKALKIEITIDQENKYKIPALIHHITTLLTSHVAELRKIRELLEAIEKGKGSPCITELKKFGVHIKAAVEISEAIQSIDNQLQKLSEFISLPNITKQPMLENQGKQDNVRRRLNS